ncbi:hypothetical protein [uncultured Pelagimonas sp.]|uniref:hypothetical protein n=1 Tax=uncultured Pelagimonas sp. TaxID=1618102 RepID=UPI002616EABC|nr:hypothetical protein [uncultured Pelagimonas sp.]
MKRKASFNRILNGYSVLHLILCFVVFSNPDIDQSHKYVALVAGIIFGPTASLFWCKSQATARSSSRFQNKKALWMILIFSALYIPFAILKFTDVFSLPFWTQVPLMSGITLLPICVNTLIYEKYFRWIDDQTP